MHRIQQLTRAQSLDLLRGVEIGRIVFTDQALPAILPVTFIVDGDTVVFRTAEGSRLTRAARDAVVAFEVDDVRSGAREGWSVVVVGHARVEADAAEQRRLDGLLHSWVPGPKNVFIRIPLTMVTGRRVLDRPLVHERPARADAG